LKRKAENDKLFTAARIARRLKRSGKVPADAILKPEDVNVDKYHGPKKLPPGHPEGVPPPQDPGPANAAG
jgi:hypothetical protein